MEIFKQYCSISIANAQDILHTFNKPLIYLANVTWLARTHQKILGLDSKKLNRLIPNWVVFWDLWHPIPSVLQHKATPQKHLMTTGLRDGKLIPKSDLHVSSYWHHAIMYYWLSNGVMEQALIYFEAIWPHKQEMMYSLWVKCILNLLHQFWIKVVWVI